MQRRLPEPSLVPVERIAKLLRVLVVGGAVLATGCASVPKGGSDATGTTAQGTGTAQGDPAKPQGDDETGDEGTGSRKRQGASQGSTQTSSDEPGGVRGW
jgi:hypothetical protein